MIDNVDNVEFLNTYIQELLMQVSSLTNNLILANTRIKFLEKKLADTKSDEIEIPNPNGSNNTLNYT